MPPNTADGIATNAAANLENIPIITRKKQQQKPAVRLAHLVRAMTPLFWAKTDMGVMVISPARMEVRPLPSTPPWIRESKVSPSTASRDTSQVAVISPMDSIMMTRYSASRGRMSGG